MKLVIISICLLVTGFQFFLDYLDYKNRNAPLPDNVKDVYDSETYAKRNAYEMENLRLSTISGICSLCLALTFLIFNFHSYLFGLGEHFTNNVYFQTYFMLGIIMVINLLTSMPFNVISTFKIEEKYGFNRTSAKTFIIDTIK